MSGEVIVRSSIIATLCADVKMVLLWNIIKPQQHSYNIDKNATGLSFYGKKASSSCQRNQIAGKGTGLICRGRLINLSYAVADKRAQVATGRSGPRLKCLEPKGEGVNRGAIDRYIQRQFGSP